MFLDFVKNISYYISHFILCRYLILNKPLERIIKQFDFYFTLKNHYQSFTLLRYPLMEVSKSSWKRQIENQCFYVLWTHLHTAFANYKCSIFLADYGNSKKTKRNIILKYILCIIIKNHNCLLKFITVKFFQQNQYIIISLPSILKEWRISEFFYMWFPSSLKYSLNLFVYIHDVLPTLLDKWVYI